MTSRMNLSALKPSLFQFYLQNFRHIVYSGSEVYCECCDKSFRKFLPAGEIRRQNAECPNCACKERHRLLFRYLKNRTNLFSQRLKLLHFAPEPYFQPLFTALPNLEYITADLDAPEADINFDITDIPFKDDYFDVILCSHVLEHVIDDRKAMAELYRVLSPNGWSILQVPLDIHRAETFEDFSATSAEDRSRLFGQRDHVRIYGLDYKNRLETSGFDVTVEEYPKTLPVEEALRNGFDLEEAIYLCRKTNF